ncbi:MAG: proline--tRNA ligase [Oscillospiraceae bacterium]|jgi:prolyl-tRNA synthetase|nr:proline--tRNA ligase [Oscillospiraceae bacterium]
MKLSALVGERFKEKPADAVVESHSLMVRGGYIKFVASGIFTELPPLKRISKKIEKIIREEMDAIDGQEVLFPVAMPASLWEESGRYQAIGSELARWSDRNKTPMVLGMTHEEACVHAVREFGNTYQRYPFMIYQIQTKFRDEPRPRAGIIRAREFTMKDAYSFHTSQEDLEAYYARAHRAYERIFARSGLPQVVSVRSDSGMMGGKVAHEFMLLTPIGEDSIVLCPHCGYSANLEASESIVRNAPTEMEELTLEDTPNHATIEAIREQFGVGFEKTCKAVVYEKYKTGDLIVVFMRGDIEANETKIRNFVGEEIAPATLTEDSPVVAGFIGPKGISERVTVLFDTSLIGLNSLICGANVKDKHYCGLNIARDVGAAEYHDFAKTLDGGVCPQCGKAGVSISRGVELGNIFQLGTKYSDAMGMRYTDENGDQQIPIMGCYGIGVGRLAASVCEVSRDEKGPIWPISIAPWDVHICALRADDEGVRAESDKLYALLQGEGLEVIYDDRSVGAGFMFSDADLLGVPIRVVVSPRNLAEGVIELSTRDKSVSEKVSLSDAVAAVKRLKAKLLEQLTVEN